MSIGDIEKGLKKTNKQSLNIYIYKINWKKVSIIFTCSRDSYVVVCGIQSLGLL